MPRPPDREPVPARFNAARYLLEENARVRPGKAALIVTGEDGREARLSFGEVESMVRRLAAGLGGLGLSPGDRIMIRMGNEPAYVLLYLAALAAGYVALPSSPQLTRDEADFLLDDSGARVMALGGRDEAMPPAGSGAGPIVLGPADIRALMMSEPLDAYADTAAEDPAYLIYTSGTTSRPKGVLHAHRAIWGRRPMHQHWLGLEEQDVVLHAGALNWAYTLGVGIMDPWAVGATAVLYDGPRDASIWPRLIERHRATLFAAVPSVFRQLLKYGELGRHDLSSLRHGITAGEALSAGLLAEWREATGRELYEALGMSEVSTYVSSGPTTPVKPGSPGRPQEGRRIAILPTEGEAVPMRPGRAGLLAVHRSEPGLMLRYWNRPEEDAAVARGEWFVGGDLAELDDDGYVWFHGRDDDVMNAFGYRVSPSEVEGILSRHPAVADVAVAELPVRADVSVIAAFVVPRDGVPLDSGELLSFCADKLAAYKQPREIVLLDALPRTANGKVQRKRLAQASGRT